ncbi:hypothetical protein H0H87_008984 [Tephrocybe sp. NHM501043]|nr:hypothetical protein H0H87_008984 [Tephrocybe sp. NHM501043]
MSGMVMPPGGIGTFNDTKIPLNLRYGDGSYGVNGTIGVSPFEFGPFKVEKQAFLSAEKSTIGGMTELGINGLFGLSFDQPDASPINHAIQTAYGATATWGASVLKNIFAQNASQPNFIAVDLARTQDLESTAGGSFNIGEYEPTYASVVSAPKIPIYPPNASRWTGLLDGITINNATVELGKSVIADTPKGKAVALFDTGSPGGVFSNAIMREIYSRIEGAAFDDVLSMWIIPCTATPEVEVVLG